MERVPLENGTVLQLGEDTYIIHNVIGTGGSGLIYSANREGSLLSYAIKEVYPLEGGYVRKEGVVVPADGSNSKTAALEELKERVREREYQNSNLAYRNNAQVLPVRKHHVLKLSSADGGKELSNQYAIMDDLSEKGCSLHAYLCARIADAGNSLALQEAVDLIIKILRAFKRLHPEIIHGDIQYGNIYLTNADAAEGDPGNPTIIDFGASHKTEDDGTAVCPKDKLYSTKGWQAPEIEFANSDIVTLTPAADVYSLGILLLKLTSHNKRVHKSTVTQDINENAANCRVSPNGREKQGYTAVALIPLNRILEKALQKEPRNRYQNAGEMLEDVLKLQACLAIDTKTEYGITPDIMRHASEVYYKKHIALFRTEHVFENGDTMPLDVYGKTDDGEPVLISDLLEASRDANIYLEAPGGAGKTFALSALFHQHLYDAFPKLGGRLAPMTAPGVVPIYVDMEKYGREEWSKSIPAMIAHEYFPTTQDAACAEKIQTLLKKGGDTSDRILLILDNLHKTRDNALQAMEEINALHELRTEGAAWIVVASRKFEKKNEVMSDPLENIAIENKAVLCPIPKADGVRIIEGEHGLKRALNDDERAALDKHYDVIGLPMFFMLNLDMVRTSGKITIASNTIQLLRKYFASKLDSKPISEDSQAAGQALASIKKLVSQLAFDMEDRGVYEKEASGADPKLLAASGLGILRLTGDNHWRFVHDLFQSFFAAMWLAERIKSAVEESSCEDDVNYNLKHFRVAPIPRPLLEALGLYLGEDQNKPKYNSDSGCWKYGVPGYDLEKQEFISGQEQDRNLISRALGLYRGIFDGSAGFAVDNLLETLKLVRGDLSGEDFSKLDLSTPGISLNGCCLGREGCSAMFRGAKVVDATFMPSGHAMTVNSANFSHCDKLVVTSSLDGTARVWDAKFPHELATLHALNKGDRNQFLTNARFSNTSDRYVITACDKSAKIWDWRKNPQEPVLSFAEHSDLIVDAVFSPDDTLVATASHDKNVKLWKFSRDQESSKSSICTLQHTDWVTSIVFDSTGKLLVSGTSDGYIRVFDLSDLEHIVFKREIKLEEQVAGRLFDATSSASSVERIIKFQISVNSLSLSPDDAFLLVSSVNDHGDASSYLLDMETGEKLPPVLPSKGIRPTAFFGADGKSIIQSSVLSDIIIWDCHDPMNIQLEKTIPYYRALALDHQGTRVVAVRKMESSFALLNRYTSRLERQYPGYSTGVDLLACNQDTSLIAAALDDGSVKVFKIQDDTFRFLGTITKREPPVVSLAWNNSHELIVLSCYDHIQSIDYQSIRMTMLAGGNCYYFASFSHDRDLCAAEGAIDHKLYFYSTTDNAELLPPIDLPGSTVSLHVDRAGNRFVILTVGSAAVYNAASHRMIKPLFSGYTGRIWPQQCALFSPFDRYIAISTNDGTRFWDAETYQELPDLFIKDAREGISFKPDDDEILIYMAEHDVIVWDVRNNLIRGRLAGKDGHTEGITCATYTPDSKYIITSSYDGTVKLWDPLSCSCIDTIYNIPGLQLIGCNLKHKSLHEAAQLTETTKCFLSEYGAII